MLDLASLEQAIVAVHIGPQPDLLEDELLLALASFTLALRLLVFEAAVVQQLADGGIGCGGNSTRSRLRLWARSRASSMRRTPSCAPWSSIKRTSPTLILSLVRSSLLMLCYS